MIVYCNYIELSISFSQAAVSMLKQEYNEEGLTLEETKKLAVKVLSKTLDMTKLTPEKG
mgnify:CR=1 FL=1